jgi:prepilin-type N-terminal cleavage/methylation domain-containing protein
MNTRGFTLTELLIALAIGSLIMLTSLSTTFTTIQAAKNLNTVADISTDLLLLTNYFSQQIPSAGGQGVPIGAAVFSENNCAPRAPFPNCNSSDRLTLVQGTAAPLCSIVENASSYGIYNASTDGTGACCLASVNLVNTQVMLVQGTFYGQRLVTNQDPSACQVTVQTGPGSLNDNVSDLPATAHDWSGASIIPVQLDTYYMDPTLNQLIDATYQGLTVNQQILADRVYDFQISLGYDFNPEDGIITDTGSITDEWLHNFPGESMGVGVFLNASPTSLRMVGIGFVFGAPAATLEPSTASVLDGPPRTMPHQTLRSELAKIALRSIYFFQ